MAMKTIEMLDRMMLMMKTMVVIMLDRVMLYVRKEELKEQVSQMNFP